MVSRGWCCYLLVALVGASAVGQDDELTVNVKVLQTDGQPLADTDVSVSIHVREPYGHARTSRAVTTDANGQFEVAWTRQGVWRMGVAADTAGWAELAPVDVRQGAPMPLVTATLQPGADLFGWVRVKGEELPIAGARVRCGAFGRSFGAPQLRTATDQDGTFILSSLMPGEVKAVASADGFASANAYTSVTVGDAPGEIVIELARTLTVQGTVLGPDGTTPIAGAVVSRNGIMTEPTDAMGRFMLHDVRPGDLRLTTMAEGHAPLTTTVDVAEGVEVEDVRIVLEHVGGTVSGVVTDGNAGGPAAGETVFLVPVPAGDWSYGFDVQHVDARELEQMLDTPSWRHYCRWNWSRAVRSDAEGRFSIENVAPGVCRVAVMRESGPDLGPCEVVVVEGEAAAPIGFMIRLRPPGHITGRLLDADGQPLELDGAHYELRWERGSGSGRVEICETGRYYVRALQAGRARLTISAVGYERVTQDVDVDPAGQDADLDFVLVPVE